MAMTPPATPSPPGLARHVRDRMRQAAPGMTLSLLLALAALWLARLPLAQSHALGSLTLAIALGAVVGNTLFGRISAAAATGVDIARSSLLRLGVILYGFRVDVQDLVHVGWPGLIMAAAVVAGVFGAAVLIGTRVFRLDRQTAMLIGAGSAICGAAAVMATEPVVRGQAHKVSVAVATVVVFGSLGMVLYPALYPHLGLSPQAYGLYAGATVHEVAQVVVAGRAVSEPAAAAAVTEKMLRVMLLAPFLMALSASQRRRHAQSATDGGRITVPWFAIAFIGVVGLHSLQWLAEPLVELLTGIDTLLLCTAMAALGLRTHLGAIRQAGLRPLLLAAVLFLILLLGGWGATSILQRLHLV